MADAAPPSTPEDVQSGHSLWGSLALTLPLFLWSLLMFSRSFTKGTMAERAAVLLTIAFLTGLIFWMMRTGETYAPRRIFFVTLGVLFPVGFITELIAHRGSMSIPLAAIVAGDTPFCHLVIPVAAIPAALTGTVFFPGSILPTPDNPHSIASMTALWLGGSILLGRGWCSWGCFFGGLDEGCASLAGKPRRRNLDRRWTLFPWAVLIAAVVLTTLTFEPFYCVWLCPFKIVTEFSPPDSVKTALQFVVFTGLFLALVVVLPYLTKKRTQCAFFCPMGPIQALTNTLNVFEVVVDPAACVSCARCVRDCPTLAVAEGPDKRPQITMRCSRCGACVESCAKGAARWHIKGTPFSAPPRTARLLFLYVAWIFAVMFGGSIIANGLSKIFHLVI